MRLRDSIVSLITLLIWIGIAPLRAGGQTLPAEASTPLTLDQAVELALAHNAEVQSAAKDIEAARGRAVVAKSLEPPQFTFELDEVPGGRLSRAGTTTLGLEQMFPFPGKRGLRGEVGALEVRSFQAQERRVRRTVTARVKESYYLARFQQERVHNLETSESLLSDFLSSTQKRFESGGAPYLDVIRAKVELARLRNDLLDVRREADLAKAALNLLIGRAGGERFDLATPLSAPPAELNRDAAVLRAQTESARLEAARLAVQSARTSRRLAGKERLPDINLRLQTSKLRDGDESAGWWGTEIGAAIPFWWWKAPAGMVREADAIAGQAEVNLAAAEREVRTASEQAFETVATTQAQVHLFESSILDDIESELRSGIDAYRTGQVDALNLLDIYRTNIEARTEYTRSLLQYLSALARLEAAGDLEP